MSEVKVNKISPRSGTAITLGDSGDTFTIPSGATLAIAGSVTGFTSAGIDDNATSVAITIDSSERVGIGITSPLDQLSVLSSGIGKVRFAPASGSVSNLLLSGVTTGDSGFQFDSNQLNMFTYGDIAFFPSTSNISGSYPNNEVMRIRNNGKVGISTSDPKEKLDSRGSAVFSGDHATATNAYGTAHGILLSSTSNLGKITAISNGSNDVKLELRGLDGGTANSNQLVLDGGTSNVGIGTSSPVTPLNVIGGSDLGIEVSDTSSGGNGVITIKGNATNGGSYLQFGDTDDDNVGRVYYTHNDNAMKFNTADAERMRITSAGLVGIGTSSPSEELEVSGAQNTITKSKTTTSTALGGFEAHGSASSYIKVFQHGPSFGGTTFGGVSGNDQSLIEAQAASSVVFSTQGNAGGSNPDFIFAPQRSAKFIIKNSGNIVVGNSVPSGASSSSYKQIFVNTGGALSDSGGSGPGTQLLNNSYVGSGNNNFATVTQKASRILMTSGRIDFATAASVSADAQQTFTDRMRINDNGVVSVPSGLALGVGTATTASNVLDDYEEGTWTGTLSDGTNNLTMGSSTGSYIKIGSLVFISGYFTVSSLGSASGNLRLNGLPFANGSSNDHYTANGGGWGANMDITDNTSIGFQLDTNASHINISNWDNITGTTPLQASELSSNGQFMLNLTYRTDA